MIHPLLLRELELTLSCSEFDAQVSQVVLPAQTMESFINRQAFISLSKYKVTILKVSYHKSINYKEQSKECSKTH